MRPLWFEKGRTGELLRGIRDSDDGPFKVARNGSVGFVAGKRYNYIGLTLRGTSRDRRQQARILERWLNNSRTAK